MNTLEEFLNEQEILKIINQVQISKDFEIVFSVILNDDLNYPPQSDKKVDGITMKMTYNLVPFLRV